MTFSSVSVCNYICFPVLPDSYALFLPGSMLHAMFSGRFDTKPSEDGSYFIDRDGTHFRYILNYLRTGQLLVPKDEIIRVELLAEAEFYQIEGIVSALSASFFKYSAILSLEQRQTLMNWLKEIRPFAVTCEKLMYCAPRDQWHMFHYYCDNRGPTLTVIRSGNYIFGGYADNDWNGRTLEYQVPRDYDRDHTLLCVLVVKGNCAMHVHY